MKCTVIGITSEVQGITEEQLEILKTFSGKNAGICYQKEGYFGTSVSDPEKASERFPKVAGTNHHSIADHVRVEVLFENISKMLAIVLNSLQDYSTSEKSGRYTVMTGNSERECELYNKWKGIYERRVLEFYPDFNDSFLVKGLTSKLKRFYGDGYDVPAINNGELASQDVSYETKTWFEELKSSNDLPSRKIAQENARYILSVFTRSTTMGYSTSLRQWNYIYDWCLKYMKAYTYDTNLGLVYYGTDIKASYFEQELYSDFETLADYIKDNLYVEELRDSKGRCFEFLTNLSGDSSHPMSMYDIVAPNPLDGSISRVSKDDKLDISYQVSYPASFVHIAQAERHRTLKYFMRFNPLADSKLFFIPPLIKDDNSLVDEWLDDLQSVSDLVPQATMINVIETGHISDFILKCEERCCGRAQLEIMAQTEETAKRFIEHCKNHYTSEVLQSYVDKFTDYKGNVATKCIMLGCCKEPCRYSKCLSEVFTRMC